MPIVSIKMFKGRTTEQKEKMIKEVTNAVCSTVNVKPEDVIVVIEEIEKDHYAIGGEVYRKKTASDNSNSR